MTHPVLSLLVNRCYDAFKAQSVERKTELLLKVAEQFSFETDAQYQTFTKQVTELKLSAVDFRQLLQKKLEHALNVQLISLDPLAPTAPLDVKQDAMSIVRLAQQPLVRSNAEVAAAIQKGEIVPELKENPNGKDQHGNPFCVIAALYGQTNVLMELAKAGADLTAMDATKKSAQFYVANHYHDALDNKIVFSMFDILLAHGGVSNPDKLWDLAVHHDSADLASLLVKYGVDPAEWLQTAFAAANPNSSVVKLAKTFMQATKSHIACIEFENQRVVTQLATMGGLPTAHSRLRVRNGVSDSDGNLIHYPMHVAASDAKLNAIDLHELKMPDGSSAAAYVQRLFTKIARTTSPVPARVKASAVAVALTGALPKQTELTTDAKDSDLATAEFVVECRNKNVQYSEAKLHLCVTWPTSSSDMKDVRVEWLNLAGQASSGSLGSANHYLLDQKQGAEAVDDKVAKAPDAKTTTRGYIAREVPNHIVNEQLAARLNANGTHALFIEMQSDSPRPVVQLRARGSAPISGVRGVGESVGHSTARSAGLERTGSGAAAAGAGAGAGIAKSVGQSKGVSAYAVVDNGAAIADTRQYSPVRDAQVLSDIEYVCIGALVVNIAGLLSDERLNYTSNAVTERYKAVMEARSRAIQAQLSRKPRYLASDVLAQLKQLQRGENQHAGELAILLGDALLSEIYEYRASTLYSHALYITIKCSVERAKALVTTINRTAGCNIATYDPRYTDAQTIYLDATLLIEFVEPRVKRFDALMNKYDEILNAVVQTTTRMPFAVKSDIAELTFLHAHGCKDVPIYARTLAGGGEHNDRVIMKLGIPFESAEALEKLINATSPHAIKIYRTKEPFVQKLAVSIAYLESPEYLQRFQTTFAVLFTGGTSAERDFIDEQFKKVGVIDQTLRDCMASLYQAVGTTVAEKTFVACIHGLMASISPFVNEVPDVKQIQVGVAAVRKQIAEYKASLPATFFKPNDPALPPELAASLAKMVTQDSKLSGVEHALETIEKRFGLKKG